MLQDESVTSFLGQYIQIRDDLGAVGEVVDPDSMVRAALHSFMALLPGRSCPLGRGCGMISFRRRLDLYQRLLNSNKQCKVLRILLFGQRERRGPVGLLTASPTRGSTPCAMKRCIIRCSFVKDGLVLQGIFDTNTPFCKRNFRTPTWVNNVIDLYWS
jgi:hypothetical protein